MSGSAIQSIHHSNSYTTLADITYEVLSSNGDIGSSANTLCAGNDSRLSDARIPTSHNHDNLYYTETEVNTISGSLHDEISNIVSGISDIVDDTTPQLGGDLDTNGKNIVLDSTPASDHFSSGLISSMVCGETIVFGNVGYLKSDGKLWLSSATSSTTMPVIAVALESGSANDSKQWLFNGFIRDESWDWTVGGVIYAATVSGSLTQTPVSATGNQAQAVGVALTQDTMLFNPSYVLVEVS